MSTEPQRPEPAALSDGAPDAGEFATGFVSQRTFDEAFLQRLVRSQTGLGLQSAQTGIQYHAQPIAQNPDGSFRARVRLEDPDDISFEGHKMTLVRRNDNSIGVEPGWGEPAS